MNTTCPSCLDEMKNPFILQCSHSICMNCIKEWCKTLTLNNSQTFPSCPLCRQKISVSLVNQLLASSTKGKKMSELCMSGKFAFQCSKAGCNKSFQIPSTASIVYCHYCFTKYCANCGCNFSNNCIANDKAKCKVYEKVCEECSKCGENIIKCSNTKTIKCLSCNNEWKYKKYVNNIDTILI